MFMSKLWTLMVALAACGEASESPDAGTPDAGAPEFTTFAVVVRGTLADADLAVARSKHDPIAMGGEAMAKAAGDIAHDVLLGTTLLDSTENEFLAIDRWTDEDAMRAFYQDPNVQQGFASLFAAPPSLELFGHAADWVSWGDMQSGDAYDPHYWHFALGTLAQAEVAQNRMAHDQVAAGGKEPSIGAGNVAHVVWLGLDDRRRFLAVDIWRDDDNLEAFYQNPDFRMAFTPLFESVSEPVYRSTDWYQW
jgi:quinol monooxygenase YgiN